MKNFLSIPNNTTQPEQEFDEQSSQFSAGDEGSNGPEFPGYDSDLSEDEPMEDLVDDEEPLNNDVEPIDVQPPPKRVRRCLEIPVEVARNAARENKRKEFWQALDDIEKIIRSRKTRFRSGQHGLQWYRALAIQSYFRMVVNNGRNGIEASEIAAESHGFAKKWGGRLVRRWVRDWIKHRELPVSSSGRHVKVYTLLSDPAICAELRTYVRSNKWSMNPQKLAEFTKNKMIPSEAEKYIRSIVDEEMPRGLKRYLEVELFPWVQLKVGKGISISTARRWLQREGFRYMQHKKALYYDGHDRPDVVDYRQMVFLPAMEEYRQCLVEFKVGEVETEILKPRNFVEKLLVLCSHDDSTTQANDGQMEGWVLDGEQPLKKKGSGRGLHQSDVICSTVGWLKDASQTLEYGKNYDGYWTGELFVKQVFN